MRHGSAIIVGGGNFQLVKLGHQDLAFSVKDHAGHNLVEAVHLHVLVVGAGAKAAHAGNAQTHISVSSLGAGLFGSGLFFHNIGIGNGIQRIVHSSLDGVAGNGSGGNHVHFGAVGFHNLCGQFFQRLGANTGGLVFTGGGHGGNLAVFHGNNNLYFTAKTLGDAVELFGLHAANNAQNQNSCQHQRKQLFHNGFPP